MDKELQGAITLTELAPSTYSSIISVHLVNINVFTKSNEISSFIASSTWVIKEETKMSRIKCYKGQQLKELAPSLYFSVINVHLMDINVFAKF